MIRVKSVRNAARHSGGLRFFSVGTLTATTAEDNVLKKTYLCVADLRSINRTFRTFTYLKWKIRSKYWAPGFLQPQERGPRNSAPQTGSRHRPLRVRQIIAGLRHDLRRGQRRCMERCRPTRRQFVGTMERPDVDKIHELSPWWPIEQKTTNRIPLDGGHRDRDQRLPAPALRRGRRGPIRP